ncbi:MAG: response regulator transcription factor [Flavobacteriales bacterium]|nr:response regulator transcription factor [Flavobacteriales bacterium]MCL4855668.1 response regulator transcription factor [Flavobacteriales bacterium]HRN40732.1 response regulator transcription factor [Vicingus sp.]HRP59337.1 response regulator transcription factor [Vicingus sp.]
MDSIKILIADDHTIIRNGLKLMLDKNSKFKIVGDVNSGSAAIDFIEKNSNQVDIVLMDIDMPGMNGIEATKILTSKHPHIKVLALTMHKEEKFINDMINAGALSYILKETDIPELVQAIENTALGKKYYSNEVSMSLINALMKKGTDNGHDLSKRELDVLKLIASGMTNKEAGEKLFISARTVESHRRNILDKLDFKNTSEMIRYAIENDLI